MKRGLPQAHVRVDGRRVSDDREHRKVTHAVAVSVGVAEAQALALGERPDP